MYHGDYRPGFGKGDIISFSGQEYIVIDNYGPCGKVVAYSQDAEVLDNFFWKYQGERAILVHRNGSLIRIINLLILLVILIHLSLLIVIAAQVIQ